jgi:SAM-dependent methyltransferase
MAPSVPNWNLPAGVDRGLWDYLHSEEMVGGYDRQMAASPLAAFDVAYCEMQFPNPGRLLDLGCGTGRLARYFAGKGYDCVGVDLSEPMLAAARALARDVAVVFRRANLTDLGEELDGSFDYAACLFSTFGMIRGDAERTRALRAFARVLRPGGRLVLHVHNRYFLRGLGLKGWRTGDVTMPQAYGGAALTLRHFGCGDIVRRLRAAGLRVRDLVPLHETGRLPQSWWLPAVRAYGYLIAADKP